MATVYFERNVLGSSLLSQLQTDIVASTDWTRPNSGSLPNLFKCTNTDGAVMAIDLNSSALSLQLFTVQAYRDHNGTTATDASGARYLRMKRLNSGSLAANTYHYTLSCGKDHFFLLVEGPRGGESNPDQTFYGSVKGSIMMDALVPYFPSSGGGPDTTPTIIFGASPVTGDPSPGNNSHLTWASRNHLGTLAWMPGYLRTLAFPGNGNYMVNVPRTLTLSSNEFDLDPYVWYDSIVGRRGRLKSFFHAGYNVSHSSELNLAPVGSIVTVGGVQYKILPVTKSDANSENWNWFGAFNNNGSNAQLTPLVAVPYA